MLAPFSMFASVVVETTLLRRTPATAPRPAAREAPSSVEIDVDFAWTLIGPAPVLSVPLPTEARVVRSIVDVACVNVTEMPVERPTVSANEVAVLLSVASMSSLFATIVPPDVDASVVPLILADASTPENAPLKPIEVDAAVAFGFESPVKAAWTFTSLPAAVKVPPLTDAVTFGWIFSSTFEPAPAPAIAP